MTTFEQRLRLAVDSYNEHPDDGIDMLLWRAGQMSREIEAAHHWLDMKDYPRRQGDGVLTLRGRMDAA
jgi:hypothetical protein